MMQARVRAPSARLCSLALWALCLVASFSSCHGDSIIVTIHGLTRDIAELRVQLTKDGLPLTLDADIIPAPSSDALELVFAGEGNLELEITALDQGRCTTHQGKTPFTVSSSRLRPVSIDVSLEPLLKHRCTISVEVKGDGQVSSSPKSTSSSSPCTQGLCRYDFIANELPVTLLPTPGPSAYTVEWESPVASCQGRAGCLLPISASITVRAYFIHSTCGRGKTGFCQTPLPPEATGKNIRGLFGFAPDDAWAVGDGGLILHYDGAAWKPLPAPGSDALLAVWGSTPKDVWITGQDGLLLHYDGSSVTPSADSRKVTSNHLNSVWGAASNNVFAVGDNGTLIHYDGASWRPSLDPGDPVIDRKHLRRICGLGSSDIWAVGSLATVLHFDGQAWQRDPEPRSITPATIHGIWCVSADETLAVGSAGARLRHTSAGWSLASDNLTTLGLFSVWGTSPNELWAVGESGTILSHNGTWKASADSQLLTKEWLLTVWGLNRWNVWIGGLNGTLLTYQP